MTKETTFWAGLLWLPITIGIMVIDISWPAFILLMFGILMWMGTGEEVFHTTNYRLGGYEKHSSTKPATPFHNGFSITAGVLFIGWVAFNIFRAVYTYN